MTCVHCGATNEGEALVCASCGKDLAAMNRPPQGDSNTNPPLPTTLKVIGYANVVFGPLLALVNLFVVGYSISLLEAQNAPEGLSTFFEINIGIYLIVGTLFLAGGIGLLRNRKWGRIWGLVAAGSCFVALLASSILGNIAKGLVESGALPLHPGQTSFYFKEPMSVAVFAPLYAILVIILSMLPDARAWARGSVRVQANHAVSGGPGEIGSNVVPAPAPATSILAIVSLICSVVPLALLTQIAGLTLGIIALVKIKKSAGALGGKGFAIAGIIISSLILLFIGGILLMVGLTGGFK